MSQPPLRAHPPRILGIFMRDHAIVDNPLFPAGYGPRSQPPPRVNRTSGHTSPVTRGYRTLWAKTPPIRGFVAHDDGRGRACEVAAGVNPGAEDSLDEEAAPGDVAAGGAPAEPAHSGADVTGRQCARGHGRAYRLDDDHRRAAAVEGFLPLPHGPAAVVRDAHGDRRLVAERRRDDLIRQRPLAPVQCDPRVKDHVLPRDLTPRGRDGPDGSDGNALSGSSSNLD